MSRYGMQALEGLRTSRFPSCRAGAHNINPDGSAGGRSEKVCTSRKPCGQGWLLTPKATCMSLLFPNKIFRVLSRGEQPAGNDWDRVHFIEPANIAFGGLQLGSAVHLQHRLAHHQDRHWGKPAATRSPEKEKHEYVINRKNAVITGGAKGYRRRLQPGPPPEGANVVILDIDPKRISNWRKN